MKYPPFLLVQYRFPPGFVFLPAHYKCLDRLKTLLYKNLDGVKRFLDLFKCMTVFI